MASSLFFFFNKGDLNLTHYPGTSIKCFRITKLIDNFKQTIFCNRNVTNMTDIKIYFRRHIITFL